MKNALERLFATKKAEIAAAKKLKEKQEETVDLGRRGVLRGIAATAAVAAVPTIPTFLSSEAHASRRNNVAEGSEREAQLEREIALSQRALRNPDFLDALAGNGNRLISRFLQGFRGIDASHVRDTSYDTSAERMRYGSQVIYGKTKEGTLGISFTPASYGEEKYAPEGGEYGVGNAVFLRPGVAITSKHVYDMAEGKEVVRASIDLIILSVPKRMQMPPENCVTDDTSLTNLDIDEQMVTIEGIDRDATSIQGCKTYAGVAKRLSRAWVDQVFTRASKGERDALARSFVIEIPVSETTDDGTGVVPAQGMSGSSVWMKRKNGEKVYAGSLHAQVRLCDPETGHCKGFAIFHGIEEVRERVGTHIRSGA